MNQPSIIDQIRNDRDTALAALNSSIDALSKKIGVATRPEEAALSRRLDDLVNLRDASRPQPLMPFSLYPRSVRQPPH